jgi:hypothetical protein
MEIILDNPEGDHKDQTWHRRCHRHCHPCQSDRWKIGDTQLYQPLKQASANAYMRFSL